MKKFRKKIFEIPQFQWKIHVLTWDVNKSKNYIKKFYDYDLWDYFTKTYWFHISVYWNSIIYLRENDLQTIIHEVTHSIQYLFQTFKLIDFNEDKLNEFLAYFISYYSVETQKFINNKK